LSDGEVKALAIGQGTVLATPVQVAVMMAAIANGGQRVVPHVRRDAFQPSRLIDGIDSNSDRSLAVVRRALQQVVSDAHGTGHEHVFLREIEIAGKTGTAQSGSPRGDHAWFAGYVPAQNPRFAIAIVLEHAGSGGHAAGPIAREFVRQMLAFGYFPDANVVPTAEAPLRNTKQK
jgi:penicillin-binding protein 2